MYKFDLQVENYMILFILILGAFLSLLNQTILNVALPNLMKEFAVSATTIQWLSTGFMLVNGIVVPVTAFLMKRFTTRQLFISSMILLLAGTLINAVAPNFSFLFAGRLIQAVGAGIIMPLLMVIILTLFPGDGRGTAMGVIGLVIIVAPAIAPALSGLIIEHFSWRALFIGMSPLVVIVTLLSFKYLTNIGKPLKPSLDVGSVVLSTIGFGGVLYGFSSVSEHAWSSMMATAVSMICLYFFVRRQLASSSPLLNLRIFNSRMFTITTVILVLSSIVMYADIILLPLYLQQNRGYSVFDTGLLMLPGALLSAAMSPISGRLFDKFGAKPLALIGLICAIIAIMGVTNLSETTSYQYLVIRTVLLRLGMTFITMPVNTGGLNALSQHLNADATAVSNTIRQIAGSIGTALPVTIMTVRAESHTRALFMSGNDFSPAQIIQQTSMRGINDAYMFTACIAIIAFFITLFMPGKKV